MDPRIRSQHRGAKSLLIVFVLLFGILTGIIISNGLDWIPLSIAQHRYSGQPARVEPSDFLVSTQESFRDLVEAVRPAVVSIQAEGTQVQSFNSDPWGMDPFEFLFPMPDPFNPQPPDRDRSRDREFYEEEYPIYSSGSGFLVDPDGYILTNNHVVTGADEITVFLDDGERYNAELIGTDPDTDVAVLKIEDDHSFPYLEMADSSDLQVGDWVMAIGNPFGYLAGSVTVGIVSATNREQLALQGGAYYQDFIQTDAAINLGNSGGPLVDIHGRAVGINTAISAQGSGIGFAIPMKLASFVYENFRQHGEVIRSWIGVTIQNLDPDLAEALGVPGFEGALIASLEPGNPAEEGGLRERDVILEVGGTRVISTASASRVIAELPVGEPAEFQIWRDGGEMTITVTPARRDMGELQATDDSIEDEDNRDVDKPPRTPRNAEYLGIEVEDLTRDMIANYGFPEDTAGVVVVSVTPGSTAWEKGLVVGTVIVTINDQDIEDLEDYERLMAETYEEWEQDGSNVVLRYLQYGQSGDWIRFFVALPFDD